MTALISHTIKIVPSNGLAYKLDGKIILFTPILADGSVSLNYDDWDMVDMANISAEEADSIRNLFSDVNPR